MGTTRGTCYELDAILAVVLGGTSLNGGKFYLVGSMVGALIIQTLTTTIYAFDVAPEISQVVKAFVVWIVCLMQSDRFRARDRGPVRPKGGVGMNRKDSHQPPDASDIRHPWHCSSSCSDWAPLHSRGSSRSQNFLNLFIDNAYLLILAVGMTFVIISGGIDLSVGSMLALATMVSSSLLEKSHMSPCS